MATDASDSHISGVLQQQEEGAWRPLGFYSRKLSETECRYSAFNRKLLAAFNYIRHFRIMMEGSHFLLWTNHKPLLAALHCVTQPWTPRQLNQRCPACAWSVQCGGRPFVAASSHPHVPDGISAAANTSHLPCPRHSGPAQGWSPYVRPAASPLLRGTWRGTCLKATSPLEFSGQ